MDLNALPNPKLEEVFKLEAGLNKPIVVGQDTKHGRRQLIVVHGGGVVSGRINGKLMEGGVDSQIIRPDGFVYLSARYGIELDTGETVYIQNDGIRRVDPAFAAEVAAGNIVDPKYIYFATVPKFEVYSENLSWMEQSIFICSAVRLPDKVILRYFEVVY